MKRSLSVVVPVFNSSVTLRQLVERCCSVLSECTQNFELVLVNDCSLDDSWNVICEIAQSVPQVRGINLSRNYGQHNALLCGIRFAKGEFLITIDDDLQNPPEEIPKLLDKLEAGYDVVYGTPAHESHGILRNIASKTTKLLLQRAMGADTAASISAFRAFRAHLRTGWKTAAETSVNIDVLLTWSSRKFVAIPVKHDARLAGMSNYTTAKLLHHALNMITGFSTVPLRLASMLGLALSSVGFAFLCYVLLMYLIYGPVVPGFVFLASVVSLFGGFQFLALGIIGEYLARVHSRTIGRPQYVIRDVTRDWYE